MSLNDEISGFVIKSTFHVRLAACGCGKSLHLRCGGMIRFVQGICSLMYRTYLLPLRRGFPGIAPNSCRGIVEMKHGFGCRFRNWLPARQPTTTRQGRLKPSGRGPMGRLGPWNETRRSVEVPSHGTPKDPMIRESGVIHYVERYGAVREAETWCISEANGWSARADTNPNAVRVGLSWP